MYTLEPYFIIFSVWKCKLYGELLYYSVYTLYWLMTMVEVMPDYVISSTLAARLLLLGRR